MSNITPHEAEKLSANIKIPPRPVVIQNAYAELQKKEPDLKKLAEIVSRDICLSALLLRTINSAYFGLKVKVRTLTHAISLLGLTNTVNILTGVALRRVMEESEGANPPNFWDSPVNIALCSAFIANRVSSTPSDEAYLTGLFLNSGQALLINSFPNYLSLIREACGSESKDLCELEESCFKLNHATIGGALAESWGIPAVMCDTIRYHHNMTGFLPTNDPLLAKRQDLLAITKFAEYIDNLFWSCDCERRWDQYKPFVLSQLQISDPEYIALKDELLEMLLCGAHE